MDLLSADFVEDDEVDPEPEPEPELELELELEPELVESADVFVAVEESDEAAESDVGLSAFAALL